jgi:hypothetical protein
LEGSSAFFVRDRFYRKAAFNFHLALLLIQDGGYGSHLGFGFHQITYECFDGLTRNY